MNRVIIIKYHKKIEYIDKNKKNMKKSMFKNIIFKSDLKLKNLKGSIFKNCKFDNIIFENTDLTGVKFNKCKFKNVIFKNCLLYNTKIDIAIIDKIKIENCYIYNMKNYDILREEFKKNKFNSHNKREYNIELINTINKNRKIKKIFITNKGKINCAYIDILLDNIEEETLIDILEKISENRISTIFELLNIVRRYDTI